jgi:hypothetical protein
MRGRNSVANIIVTCDGVKHDPNDNYAYLLEYTRCGGWCLWWRWDGTTKLIGRNHDKKPFKVEIDGHVIVDYVPDEEGEKGEGK